MKNGQLLIIVAYLLPDYLFAISLVKLIFLSIEHFIAGTTRKN